MSLKTVINQLPFILTFVMVFMVILYLFLRNLTPVYESSVTFMVNQNTPTKTLNVSVLTVSEQLSETFVRLAKTKTVLDNAAKILNLKSIDEDRISTTLIPRTQLFKVSVKASTPANAMNLTNGVAQALIKEVDKVQSTISPEYRAVVSVVEPAALNNKAVFPQIPQTMILGFVVIFGLSLMTIYLMEYFDATVENEDDIMRIFPSTPIVGSIPMINKENGKEILDAFHELKTNYSFVSHDKSLKVITVCSANAGEGKSYVALELAQVLANTDKKVLLIDTDLRQGGLTKRMGVNNDYGLAEALQSGKNINEINTYKFSDDRLNFINAGKGTLSPDEIYSSKACGDFFQAIKEAAYYDYILVDTPPLLAVADGITVATKTDAALVVVSAGHTDTHHLEEASNSLKNVNVAIVGFVLNRVKHPHRISYKEK